jgi:hypothetical protein
MKSVQNPFFHRGPIRQRDHFFGRQRRVSQALSLLRNQQSVALVGQRRVGKTSLLFHLADPVVRGAHGLSPAEYVFVYLDGEELTNLDAGQLRTVIAKELTTALRESSHSAPTLSDDPLEYHVFRQVIHRLTQQDLKFVFCFDEFEYLAANPRLGPSFFSSLRGLASSCGVAYVIVSRTPIYTLAYAHAETLSSPFFNIFASLHVGLFSYDDARGLIEKLSADAGLSFPSELIDYIIELAGPHPLLLQIAGFYAFEGWRARGGKWTDDDYGPLRHHFQTEAYPHFEYYWRHLSAEEQHTLATLPLAQQMEEQWGSLRSLEQQCLVVRCNDHCDYLSPTFEAFVRRQSIPDVLQLGPFVLDLRQRVALSHGAPLVLTKTELQALAYFLRHAGRVISFRELEEALWPGEYVEDPDRVRSIIKSLRKALGDEADCLATSWGVGYMFRVLH